MRKYYYTRFALVLPAALLLLIASAVAVAAQEVANSIGIPEAAPITVAKAVQWDYKSVLIAWAAAIAIGVGVVEFWKYKMNTVFLKREADAYVIPNSLVFHMKKDSFLYSYVTKIRRQTQNRSR
jgi:hypothetical protein